MFDELYKKAYEELSTDIRRLVRNLLLDNAWKNRSFRDGLIEACQAFLQLASESSGELSNALNHEAEKEAAYYSHEKH